MAEDSAGALTASASADEAGSSNFSYALTSWRDINLAELQKTLDAQGTALREDWKERT